MSEEPARGEHTLNLGLLGIPALSNIQPVHVAKPLDSLASMIIFVAGPRTVTLIGLSHGDD